MRVVFDTNVLVSALLSPQNFPAMAVKIARSGGVQSLTSHELLDEFHGVLQDKFRLEPGLIDSIIHAFIQCSEIIKPQQIIHEIKSDPDDNRVLECAFEGKANAIVTGDRHLLALKNFRGIPLVTVREFFELIHHA